ARAGNAGDVVTVVLPEQRKELQLMMRRAGINVSPQQVAPQSEPVQALVGEVAPYQAPVTPKPQPTPTSSGPNRTNSRRGRSGVSRQHRHIGGGRVQLAETIDAAGGNRQPRRRTARRAAG